MVSSVLNIWLFLVLIMLLAVNIWNIAWFFWLLSWIVSQLFNVMSYFWADCTTITTVSTMFTSAVVVLLIIKIYSHLKPWWN